jgi:hypothetical protein
MTIDQKDSEGLLSSRESSKLSQSGAKFFTNIPMKIDNVQQKSLLLQNKGLMGNGLPNDKYFCFDKYGSVRKPRNACAGTSVDTQPDSKGKVLAERDGDSIDTKRINYSVLGSIVSNGLMLGSRTHEKIPDNDENLRTSRQPPRIYKRSSRAVTSRALEEEKDFCVQAKAC